MIQRTKRGYILNYRRELGDVRDFLFMAPRPGGPLPASVDLRQKMPPIYDQGSEGSCTANMACAALDYAHGQRYGAFVYPSRNFQYYNARLLEGHAGTDAGATIRDAYRAAAKYGICPESEWPYELADEFAKPSAQCYLDAKKNVVASYQAVAQTRAALLGALAAGQPVGVGISVHESFESDAVAASGLVPLPGAHERLLGGHALLLVGYETGADGAVLLVVRNSWGTAWGLQGYGKMPLAYLLNTRLASDFWTVVACA